MGWWLGGVCWLVVGGWWLVGGEWLVMSGGWWVVSGGRRCVDEQGRSRKGEAAEGGAGAARRTGGAGNGPARF